MNPAIADWLSLLFKERIGSSFTYSIRPDGSSQLTLEGSEKAIVFTAVQPDFFTAGSDPGFKVIAVSDKYLPESFGASLPAPGCECLPEHLIVETTGGYEIAYDLPGVIFWALSRQEEMIPIEQSGSVHDQHGRFMYKSSHAYRYGYLDRPFIDEWFIALRAVVTATWPSVELTKRKFDFKVSHDVDVPSTYAFKKKRNIARIMLGDLLKRKSPSRAAQTLNIRMNSKTSLLKTDPMNTFSWIMDQSEKKRA